MCVLLIHLLWELALISLCTHRLAYRHGVTRGIVAPQSSDKLVSGLSVAFSLGASNKVEVGAVAQRIVALHAEVTLKAKESVSTQVARLRALLLDAWRLDKGKEVSELIEAAQRVVKVSRLVSSQAVATTDSSIQRAKSR